MIISGSLDHTVRLWDGDSRIQLSRLEGHEGGVRSVALGKLSGQSVIISGSSDHTVRVWDNVSGTQLHCLEGHEAGVRSVVQGELSGRSVIISGSSDRTVRVWDSIRGTLLQTICFGSALYSVVLGKNGELGVGTSRGLLMLKLTPAIFDNK